MAGEGLGGPSSKLPNMTMSAPTTAVARGPNLSSRMPRGSLHSAFPAMPIVATVFISDDLQQAPTGLQGEPGLRLREGSGGALSLDRPPGGDAPVPSPAVPAPERSELIYPDQDSSSKRAAAAALQGSSRCRIFPGNCCRGGGAGVPGGRRGLIVRVEEARIQEHRAERRPAVGLA